VLGVRDVSEPTSTRYDEVLYPGSPLPQTHPDRLATLATLFGMKPAPVERCRVLELGCGDGGNLIPMAFGLPESDFVGIDLAARPIAKGHALVEALGLRNIRLLQLDVMDVTADLGVFDYIIAHGIYSWVPPAVQDKILAVCRANLTPQGVAYVSYNTYPGYHLQGLARDMMRFHVRGMKEPREQAEQALALLKFVAGSQAESGTYGAILRTIFELLLTRHSASLHHDELAETNLPVYFHEFVACAARHGLQFLSEADSRDMQDGDFPAPVRDTLRRHAQDQIVLKEQYLDFLRGRKFRRTLLAHQEVALDRHPRPDQMRLFSFDSTARPLSSRPEIGSDKLEQFEGPRGATMATWHPLAKAALLDLVTRWPKSLRFDELLGNIRRSLGRENGGPKETESADAVALGEILMAAYAEGLVELHSYEPAFVAEVSQRPVASPLARRQIETDDMVATLRHTSVRVEGPLERALLKLLDGTRDRAALLRDLKASLESGEVPWKQLGILPGNGEEMGRRLAEGLDRNLARLGRLALLVA
jgi:methyltransferase-like protein/2-polyprenyl-3-methyl-5-hydroxy-6-metoxy-1,4-benzoquinol methylase